MINAQILAKTLVSPGQNARSIQGKQSGSDQIRLQDPGQPPSDLAVEHGNSLKDGQGSKTESAPDSKDFKHALNEKMAESKQAASPEDSPEPSQDPTPTTLQSYVTPVQGLTEPQSNPPIQITAGVTLSEEPPVLVSTEPVLVPQTEAQNSKDTENAQNGTKNEPVISQTPVLSAVPETTEVPGEPVNDSQKLKVPTEPVNDSQRLKVPAEPANDSQESKVPVGPSLYTPESAATQYEETNQTTESSAIQADAQPVIEPITQDTPAQPVGSSTAHVTDKPVEPQVAIYEGVSPKPEQTDPVQSQPAAARAENTPVAPEPPQIQPLQVDPESKPLPTKKTTFDIQSMPQEDSHRGETKAEPLTMSHARQKPQAEALDPIQVSHPIQQAVTTKLESSHEQPVMTESPDTSETNGGLQPTQTTPSGVGLPETPVTPPSAEASLPRTLDPATTLVARQIQESIAQGIQQDSRQIILRLDPPELGRVAIRFQEDDQGITGVLEVQRSQTRHDIQQALPEIIQHLQNSGVQIKRIEVLLSANADPETFEDQAFSQAQDQGFEQQQTSGNNTAHRSPSFRWASSPGGAVPQPRQEQYVSDQGIDMLI